MRMSSKLKYVKIVPQAVFYKHNRFARLTIIAKFEDDPAILPLTASNQFQSNTNNALTSPKQN